MLLSNVKHGVPQGSILSPLFFLLYIKDLPAVVTAENAKLVLYADDNSLIITDPSPIEFADKYRFTNVNEQFRNNSLFLNFNKNCLLEISNKKQSETKFKH